MPHNSKIPIKLRLRKISIYFGGYADAAFSAKADHIVNSMTGNDYFPNPTPAMGLVQDGKADYNAAFAAAIKAGLPEAFATADEI